MDLIDYHSIGETSRPMYDPPHPGEMIRDILEDEEVTWSVTECAQRLDVARNTPVAAAQWTAWNLATNGAGTGAHRLEQRRSLDASSGGL